MGRESQRGNDAAFAALLFLFGEEVYGGSLM